MKRLLTLWLTFLAAFWFTRTAVSALLVQRADHDLAAVLQLLAVPALQALAVAWMTREPGPAPLAGLVQEVRGNYLILGLLAFDVAAIVLLARDPAAAGPWTGFQLITAGLVAALFTVRVPWFERAWTASLAAGLFASGFLLIGDWRPELPRPFAAAPPAVLGIAGLGLLLRVQPILGRWNPLAASTLDAAMGLGWAAALLAVLDTLHPLTPAGLPSACLLLAATALLIALFLALKPPAGNEPAFPDDQL